MCVWLSLYWYAPPPIALPLSYLTPHFSFPALSISVLRWVRWTSPNLEWHKQADRLPIQSDSKHQEDSKKQYLELKREDLGEITKMDECESLYSEMTELQEFQCEASDVMSQDDEDELEELQNRWFTKKEKEKKNLNNLIFIHIISVLEWFFKKC